MVGEIRRAAGRSRAETEDAGEPRHGLSGRGSAGHAELRTKLSQVLRFECGLACHDLRSGMDAKSGRSAEKAWRRSVAVQFHIQA